MPSPRTLDKARATFREQRAKVTESLSALAGSRWLLAVLATFAISFSANLFYAPSRLPNVGGLSLVQAGLPPNLDFGVVGEQAAEASAAARSAGVTDMVIAFLLAHPMPVNAVGLGVCLALLAMNLTIMTKRRRVSPE
jgi:hypothetical protein